MRLDQGEISGVVAKVWKPAKEKFSPQQVQSEGEVYPIAEHKDDKRKSY